MKLREYLLRGGFLMVDDFHGTREWEVFMESMQRVFPDRPDRRNSGRRSDLPHVLGSRRPPAGSRRAIPVQRPDIRARRLSTPHWRGIYDDHGRIMVAICHNMDLGDSVEHSDTPGYPEQYSAQGMRIYINYIIYAMTH